MTPCVYILASDKNGTLYVGVTSDLGKRVYERKQDLVEGFTKTHQVHSLVYFEVYEEMAEAILRENQIKKWNRAWKLRLIEKNNPKWWISSMKYRDESAISWIPAFAGRT